MGSFTSYLRTKSFRKNLLWAIGTAVLIVLVAFFSLGAYTRHGSSIPVPKLKGIAFDKAMQILSNEGFRYKVDSAYVLDKPPGTVIEQDPDAGTAVKEGRTVYLTIVSRVAPNVPMPDLENVTFREADAMLSNYGLRVGDTSYTSDIARDVVLEFKYAGQTLKAGAVVPKGAQIDLVLGDGKGASEVEIPDLTNLDIDAAKFAIRGAGLSLGSVMYEGSITDSTNLVVASQMPARTDSTTKTSIGTRINLVIRQGNGQQPQQQQEKPLQNPDLKF
ncbi:MAG: PASTA domain-containing protein [Mucilaginibacter polytrichastri]|nr:PASTA domain-containing protein [Mucilaginibacter polytrichastri]